MYYVEKMNKGVRLPEITSTRFLNITGNTKKHQPSSVNEKTVVSKRANPTSLYTLHCFYKLASQELTPSYRKQAAVRQAEIDLNKHRKKIEEKNVADVTSQNRYALGKRKINCLQKLQKQRGRDRTTSMLESTYNTKNNANKANILKRRETDSRIVKK